MSYIGTLRKMQTEYTPETGDLQYYLNLDNNRSCSLNELLGKEISISFNGNIFCTFCGSKTKKTFSDGLCYRCFMKLPQADMCIMKPHECHFDKGTCRDEEWGLKHCFQPQTLYLSRSSCVKIGITRKHQQFTRWADQGAVEAMAIGTFPSRKEVGMAEVAISAEMSDRTNWRNMLKNVVVDTPFEHYQDKAKKLLSAEQLQNLHEEFTVYKFNYPVQRYPEKVKSFKLDKVPLFSKELTGIKGQYLIFGDEVINIRSHSGYEITVNC